MLFCFLSFHHSSYFLPGMQTYGWSSSSLKEVLWMKALNYYRQKSKNKRDLGS